VDALILFLTLKEMVSVSSLRTKLAVVLLYTELIMLRYVPFLCSSGFFFHESMLNFVKDFSACTEKIVWFLSFILFMCCIELLIFVYPATLVFMGLN
jgi:hypothetical protein